MANRGSGLSTFFFAAAAGAALFLGAAESRATETPGCDCTRYESLVSVSSLADRVAAVGMRTLSLGDGGAFVSDLALERQVVEEARSLIPEECHRAVLGERTYGRLRVIVRQSSESRVWAYTETGNRSLDLLVSYQDVLNLYTDASACSAPPEGAADAAMTAFADCVRNARRAGFNAAQGALRSGNAAGRIGRQARARGMDNPFEDVSAEDQRLVRTFSAMMSLDSRESLHAFLGTPQVRALSFDGKVALLSMWGRRAGDSYDNARADDQGEDANGVVPVGDIHNAIRENTARGLYGAGGSDPLYSETDWEGICRDIATSQVGMARAMGIRRTYSVGHDTLTGGHRDVILQDPNNPNRVVRMDYGVQANVATGDSRALFAGMNDGSLRYRLYDENGPVGTTDSEWGRFLREAVGADIRTADPMARSRSSIQGADLTLDADGRYQFRLLHGTDGIGSEHTGAAISGSWGSPSGIAPGSAGVYVGTMTRPGALSPDPNNPVSIDAFYFHLQQSLNTPWAQLSPTVRARIENQAIGYFAATHLRSGVTGEDAGRWDTQWDVRWNTGITVEQGDAFRDRFSSRFHMGAQFYPDVRDPREGRSLDTMGLVFNHMVLSAEGRLRLSRSAEGRAFLMAATTVMIDEFGPRIRAEAGVVADTVAVTGTYEGRLDSDGATFVDGARRTAGAALLWRPNPVVSVGGSVSVPLEPRYDDPLAGASIGPMGSGGGVTPQFMGNLVFRF
ncbi:MAG: hypothetical protein IT285_08275 [Bdellovibrionales bacterium]|nr:hypothetical protein [Bdellovibrionales bacterium]